MPYTLMTAATACGINRSTVLRAIKAGRISATKDEITGAWLIEPAEMHRLYPPIATPGANDVAAPKDAPSDATTDALVAELRAQLTDMRKQRDAWQGIAERLALGTPVAQKPAPTVTPPPVVEAPAPASEPARGMAPVHSPARLERHGWWPPRWLRSTG